LGALDTSHCESDWVYAPQVDYYDVHLESVSAELNGEQVRTRESALITKNYFPHQVEVKVNKTVGSSNFRWFDLIYMPWKAKKIFINASAAVYNKTNGFYMINCDLAKAKNVIFNIGCNLDSNLVINLYS
jgi:hypothetical protein